MWRSLFLAMGLFALLVGGESMLIDNATLAPHGEGGHEVVVPPEWAPWSLMSTGAVVMLYSITLPQKLKG